ncbi:hypothetical protein BKA69DRAFT_1088077 [Paraphysoderma sedebokerense]|nr:hypothetical protein BKA69DRAFT_1087938 [Paraphysoderma sedebokerense]KAI9139057.1 hypothetical protein BKA69DRAFT_1088077 [Paraphysoderma sedebokerense]
MSGFTPSEDSSKDYVAFVSREEYLSTSSSSTPSTDQQSAYNPTTGEINWDCPCLGGMANGPCGEEFKTAFSCFVYSEAEPKGVDCVDKFKDMQECFRKYPEVYGEELDDDEEEVEGDLKAETEQAEKT